MIHNSVRLVINDLGSLDNVTINNVDNGRVNNNVSADLSEVLNRKSKGGNPFILGSSTFDSGANLVGGKRDYFISGEMCNSNGTFESPYRIVITGKISSLTICFDEYNNNYATEIYVDDAYYSNNSPIFVIELDENITYHTIQIERWSKGNSPLIIQGIYATSEYLLNQKDIVELDLKAFDRSDINLPCWSVYSNSGNVRFKDTNGFITSFARENRLENIDNIEIYVNYRNRSKLLGEYVPKDWQIDTTIHEVNLLFEDGLTEWQNIESPRIDLQEEQTLFDLFELLREQTPAPWQSRIAYPNNETMDYLYSVTIPFPYIEEGSLWSQWQKFCEVSACYLSRTLDGNIDVYYNRGL